MVYTTEDLQNISFPIFEEMFLDYLMDRMSRQHQPNVGGFVNGVVTKEQLQGYYPGPFIDEVLAYMNENETRLLKTVVVRQPEFVEMANGMKQTANARMKIHQPSQPIKPPKQKSFLRRLFFI